MLTHIHPSPLRFASRTRLGLSEPILSRRSVRDRLQPSPPSAQSPFAHPRCYLRWGDVSHHLRGHYPPFIAHTGSCARPNPSCRLRLSLFRQVFAGCCQPLLGDGLSRRYLCESFSGCLDPYPGGSSGAFTRFFPEDIGLHQLGSGSALNDTRTATSVRKGFRGCSHSLMFRPPDLLATQIAPTAAFLSEPRAAVTFTSTHISVRYLPEQWIC